MVVPRNVPTISVDLPPATFLERFLARQLETAQEAAHAAARRVPQLESDQQLLLERARFLELERDAWRARAVAAEDRLRAAGLVPADA